MPITKKALNVILYHYSNLKCGKIPHIVHEVFHKLGMIILFRRRTLSKKKSLIRLQDEIASLFFQKRANFANSNITFAQSNE